MVIYPCNITETALGESVNLLSALSIAYDSTISRRKVFNIIRIDKLTYLATGTTDTHVIHTANIYGCQSLWPARNNRRLITARTLHAHRVLHLLQQLKIGTIINSINNNILIIVTVMMIPQIILFLWKT